MWSQHGFSYRHVLVLALAAAWRLATSVQPPGFNRPNNSSIIMKGEPFNVTWVATHPDGKLTIKLVLYRVVDSEITEGAVLHDEVYTVDMVEWTPLWYLWTPSEDLSYEYIYVLALETTEIPGIIISADFMLNNPNSPTLDNQINRLITATPTLSVTSSTSLSSFPSITTFQSSVSSVTTSLTPSPESSITPGSSNSSPAAAIGGSVGGVVAVIIIAIIVILRRKGWFIGKRQDPEVGELEGGQELKARPLSELEGKRLPLVTAELPGSIPAYELPDGDLDGDSAEHVGTSRHE